MTSGIPLWPQSWPLTTNDGQALRAAEGGFRSAVKKGTPIWGGVMEKRRAGTEGWLADYSSIGKSLLGDGGRGNGKKVCAAM